MTLDNGSNNHAITLSRIRGMYSSHSQLGMSEEFGIWASGQTGYPLVDANMRELRQTGWMSNRGRQNVASFLIWDLGVDWRRGARWFETQLTDYDVTSNWCNWVAAAGLTGGRINRFQWQV